MSTLDWIVLLGVLGLIVIYGVLKTRKQNSLQEFILGDQTSQWWMVGFTVMATQASAITFISTTGQGFSDGLRFVQFYFGLPLAMIVICISFIPRFYHLKVLTAYEYLEQRFDYRTRTFAAIIFLIQRGLAAGITLYAPSIILSTVFGWNLQWTHIISGIGVILYTVSGGAAAVTKTQLQQLFVIFAGMVFIFYYMLNELPVHINFVDTLEIASWSGRTEAVDFSLDFNNRYNFWAGITGGFFLALAYFGTDQSQVQRYLAGKNIKESRMGLIMNGILKIPMQVFILLCGVVLFVVYQFQTTPIHFNDKVTSALKEQHTSAWNVWQSKNDSIHYQIQSLQGITDKSMLREKLSNLQEQRQLLKTEVEQYVGEHLKNEEKNDRDYVFLHYIIHHLPKGFIGLMIAVILCAAMSSISAELNALSGTSTVDIMKRSFPQWYSKFSELGWSRILTSVWGVIAICFAMYAQLFENLIQFINIVGSLFYGTVLGIFLTAFYLKNVESKAVFPAALVAQTVTILLFCFSDLGFLWYNVISCGIVMGLASSLQYFRKDEAKLHGR
ncbi:MAG: sodium:solute symporter [Saprospiraceae bacterium]|nr:sodium:solute symporter [Saprospiraceae bacterium]